MVRIAVDWKTVYNAFMCLLGIVLVLLGISMMADGYTLINSSASPDHIFKCQESLISANFSGGGITNVYSKLTKHDASEELYLMTPEGGGYYTYKHGNNNQTRWGNKSISFIVDAGGNSTNTTDSYVFVYSDQCTGTNITNISIGIGNYTNPLQNDSVDFFGWVASPYTEYWGPSIYVIILFVIISVIYIKNQNIAQPLLMAFIGLAALAASTLIPDSYRNYIMLFMATALAAIFWKVFKS